MRIKGVKLIYGMQIKNGSQRLIAAIDPAEISGEKFTQTAAKKIFGNYAVNYAKVRYVLSHIA